MQVLFIAASLAFVTARPQKDNHGRGHAYSSQSIVVHHTHHEHKQGKQSSGHQEQHESHGQYKKHKATSSQQIYRHDVPSKAPADHHVYYVSITFYVYLQFRFLRSLQSGYI